MAGKAARVAVERCGSQPRDNENALQLIIYWSKDDDSFVVEVPELPGCMSDGQTYAEAVANAEVVIDEWIETARKLGRPIPEPRGKLAYA